MTNPDFVRLANLMAARRRDLEVAAGHRGGSVQIPDVGRLATAFRVSHATMAQRTEIDHHWAAGSVDNILGGGDPTPLDGIPDAMKPKPRRKGITPDFRAVASVTEQDIGDAVTAARAIVELADLRDNLEAECELLEAKAAEVEKRAKAAGKRAETYRQRLFSIENVLHAEATHVETSCGDGSCQEETPLGYCQECKASYPCVTALVAQGKSVVDARETVRRRTVKPDLAAFGNLIVTP